MRAGVFDSGIGGLTVVKSLLEHKLFEEIIYYGDTARVPYGSKDKNTIIRYGIEAVEFFKNFDIDLLIVACNSVSAFALEEMQEVADYPVIGVVEAGVLATANKVEDQEASILVIGTKATVASKAYETGLKKSGYKNILSLPTPLFVPLVEEDIFEGAVLESVLHHYFKGVATPDAVILGCTHFPLISSAIGGYFEDKPLLVHSGEAIVAQLERRLPLPKRFETTKMHFFASDNPAFLKSVASRWLSLQ